MSYYQGHGTIWFLLAFFLCFEMTAGSTVPVQDQKKDSLPGCPPAPDFPQLAPDPTADGRHLEAIVIADGSTRFDCKPSRDGKTSRWVEDYSLMELYDYGSVLSQEAIQSGSDSTAIPTPDVVLNLDKQSLGKYFGWYEWEVDDQQVPSIITHRFTYGDYNSNNNKKGGPAPEPIFFGRETLPRPSSRSDIDGPRLKSYAYIVPLGTDDGTRVYQAFGTYMAEGDTIPQGECLAFWSPSPSSSSKGQQMDVQIVPYRSLFYFYGYGNAIGTHNPDQVVPAFCS